MTQQRIQILSFFLSFFFNTRYFPTLESLVNPSWTLSSSQCHMCGSLCRFQRGFVITGCLHLPHTDPHKCPEDEFWGFFSDLRILLILSWGCISCHFCTFFCSGFHFSHLSGGDPLDLRKCSAGTFPPSSPWRVLLEIITSRSWPDRKTNTQRYLFCTCLSFSTIVLIDDEMWWVFQ